LIGVSSFSIFRSFRRYNSELWLEDIPRDVKVVVALAECDEIANTPRIVRAIDLHNSRRASSHGGMHGRSAFVEKIIWRDSGHAACITNPTMWSDIRRAMLRVESQISKEESYRKD
jgi:hypothetical protein